ncbi:MAG: hypothetical protein SWX82_23545 [Cyanobacteriota bacterium]|nr:hypothetical protein [Cyanobacteriota bacterium]
MCLSKIGFYSIIQDAMFNLALVIDNNKTILNYNEMGRWGDGEMGRWGVGVMW